MDIVDNCVELFQKRIASLCVTNLDLDLESVLFDHWILSSCGGP